MTQAEVARRASTSQPAVARYEAGRVSPSVDTLERLLHACGKRLQLQATAANASDLSGELGRLVRSRRSEITRVARTRGATKIRVFGSVARGTEHAGSDIDLLVELAPGRTLVDIGVLAEELTAMLGVDVDVATEDLLRHDVRTRALQEAVPL
jgi:predicted nucleotidyltransferase